MTSATRLVRNSIVLLALIFITGLSVFAARSGDRVWREIDDSTLQQRALERQIVPDIYRTYRLDKTALNYLLDRAPEEFTNRALIEEIILTLPMPDGTFGRFRIEHSLVVEPGLLEKYPELGRTFRAQGIDDPTATARIDFLPTGFHAMIRSAGGTVFVDPYAKGDTDNYISYFKKDVRPTEPFYCGVGEKTGFEAIFDTNTLERSELATDNPPAEVTSGAQLRTYRLAVAATNEYAVAVGGNLIAGTLAAQVLIMNRVNGVYERDLAIHMNIVANNDLIIYAGDNMSCGGSCTGANDPYSNTNGSTMLGQNQANLDAVIGTANYDIGHVFSTGGGGVATLNGPCGGTKARGVTGLSNPVGDAFAIDYVAHEMGHQWSANHTFNGTVSNCGGGNRSAGSAYEPGSGITIMAYAGICGSQDLAGHSIDTFHVKSLEVIVGFSQTGNGNTCAVTTASGNTPPTVSVVGGSAFNIPKQTPFTLTATGSDVNGDSITYDWQEYDLGASTTGVPNTDSDGQARPIFRPFLPTTGGSRTFPSLTNILNNANVPPNTTGGFLTGELLPSITRTMNFQVIARDNRATAGGINTANAVVTVDGNSGPFAVTGPNTSVSWAANSSQAVSWSVANTSGAPVNAANVKISLSTDGGLTFPTTILASTPNDGAEMITVPNILTSTARIKVEAVGNIFFDISDVNFSITAGGGTISATVQTNPAGRAFTVDGNPYTTTTVFNWTPGSSHTIATTTPQSGAPGTTYNFANWSDAGAISHVVAPSVTTTYTANFTTQSCTYSLTPTSQNFPVGGGSNSVQVNTQAGCAWTSVANSLVDDNAIAAVFPGTGVGPIPDATAGGPQVPGVPLDITFTVTGLTGAPAIVEVSMTGAHTYLGDLKAVLIAPNGTTFTVFGYTGATSSTSFGSTSEISGTYSFKDSAAGTNWWVAGSISPVPVGDYRTTVSGPTSSPAAVTNLTAAFSGVTNPNGTWTLRVTDGASQDTGNISAASLTLAAAAPINWITITSGQSGNGSGPVGYTVAANATGSPRTGTMTIAGQTFTVNQSNTATLTRARFDYDGDNKTDISIWRSGPGEWWYQRSSDGGVPAAQFGATTDKIAPADFTGDGKTDLAFFRPSTGTWYVLRSEDLSFYGFPFGSSSDVPVPADYDGDGKADPAVFRPSSASWFILRSSNGGVTSLQFGIAGDKPVIADYDGDGKADIGIYRPNGGTGGEWWIQRSTAGLFAATFGNSTDKTVAGDYTGDGKADCAFFRPSNGTWYVLRSEDQSFFGFPFGSSTDIPVPGDYDGDGKSDAAVFRPSGATWFINRSTAGVLIQNFGVSTDTPVPNTYVN